MSILKQIVSDKHIELGLKKDLVSTKQLEQSELFHLNTHSLTQKLRKSTSGIIAEHKRRSPSKAAINLNSNIESIARGYENAGACGMSVLTDEPYFGGTLDDLKLARSSCNLPLLRKDFIIDEYQIIEAKANGADVILLIAAVLSRDAIKHFSELAKSLELEVLLEVHNEEELHKSIMPSIDLLGVNNRNLKTFETSIDISKSLSELIPDDFIKVSESGIHSVDAIRELKTYGYQGFLIGENFMKTNNPGKSASEFIKSIAL